MFKLIYIIELHVYSYCINSTYTLINVFTYISIEFKNARQYFIRTECTCTSLLVLYNLSVGSNGCFGNIYNNIQDRRTCELNNT